MCKKFLVLVLNSCGTDTFMKDWNIFPWCGKECSSRFNVYIVVLCFGKKNVHHFLYEPELKLAVCKDGQGTSFPFPGVFLWENFISEEEEMELVGSMDQDVWNPSQSGRRKQVRLHALLPKFCKPPLILNEANQTLVFCRTMVQKWTSRKEKCV